MGWYHVLAKVIRPSQQHRPLAQSNGQVIKYVPGTHPKSVERDSEHD